MEQVTRPTFSRIGSIQYDLLELARPILLRSRALREVISRRRHARGPSLRVSPIAQEGSTQFVDAIEGILVD